MEVIPTPAALSFDLFVSKKTLNNALTLIQKQLKDVMDKHEVTQAIYSHALVDAIFVYPESAAESVLDNLSVWATMDGQNAEQIKSAAGNLIAFGQGKGKNLEFWVALIRADSVRGPVQIFTAYFVSQFSWILGENII